MSGRGLCGGMAIWLLSIGCSSGTPAAVVRGVSGDTAAADGADPSSQAPAGTGSTGDTGNGPGEDSGELVGAIHPVVYQGSVWLELFTEAGNDRCEGTVVLDATGDAPPGAAASGIACGVFGAPFETTGTILFDPGSCAGTFAWSGVEVPFSGECDATRVTGTLDATWIDGWVEAWDRNATLCGAFELEAQ